MQTSNSESAVNKEAQGAARGIRLWPLAAMMLLFAISLAWIWLVADLTRSWRVVYTGEAILLAGFCSLVWLAVLSRLAWRTRAIWLALMILPLVALIVLFRVDKVSGDLIPSLAWRFSAKPHEKLSAPDTSRPSADVSHVIDLATASLRDYPQYMNKNRDATLQGVRLARDWTAHPPRLVWRQPIGAGWSSFAVVGDYAVTQEQRGPQEMVTCYELLTGKLCWSYADDVYYESKIAGDGPRATPTLEGGRVYTMGSTGLLNCLDGATGQRLWQRDVLLDTSPKNSDWGKACSPLVIDELVVVTGGAERGPTLVAYASASGELAWKANDQPTAKESYGSPMIVELAGVRQIVMLNDNTVCGYHPATGEQLWEHPWPGHEPKVTQPLLVGDDRLLVGSGYGVGCALLEFSLGEDGRLMVKELWASRHLEPKFTNVVHRDGFVYGLDEAIMVCLDLQSGKRRWKKGRYGHGQIMLIEDVILVLAENGEAALVEATPDAHRELARFPALEGKTWGHPVLAPPYLLLRNDHEAACYELAFDSM